MCGGRPGAQERLHLAEPSLDQLRTGLLQVFKRLMAHQDTAGVGGRTISIASQQRTNRQSERLALDVPKRDIYRGYRQHNHTAGPGAGRPEEFAR